MPTIMLSGALAEAETSPRILVVSGSTIAIDKVCCCKPGISVDIWQLGLSPFSDEFLAFYGYPDAYKSFHNPYMVNSIQATITQSGPAFGLPDVPLTVGDTVNAGARYTTLTTVATAMNYTDPGDAHLSWAGSGTITQVTTHDQKTGVESVDTTGSMTVVFTATDFTCDTDEGVEDGFGPATVSGSFTTTTFWDGEGTFDIDPTLPAAAQDYIRSLVNNAFLCDLTAELSDVVVPKYKFNISWGGLAPYDFTLGWKENFTPWGGSSTPSLKTLSIDHTDTDTPDQTADNSTEDGSTTVDTITVTHV